MGGSADSGYVCPHCGVEAADTRKGLLNHIEKRCPETPEGKQRAKRISELTFRLKAAAANRRAAERQVVLFDGDVERFKEEIRRLREEEEETT